MSSEVRIDGPVQARKPLPDVLVEVGDLRNRNPMFAPLKEVLRGWWKQQNLRGAEHCEEIDEIPDLPGLHIAISPSQSKATIYDPLNARENAQLLAKFQAVRKSRTREVPRPQPDRDYPLSPSELKSWLYWTRRMVDEGNGRLVAEKTPKMPTYDEIAALPGRTLANAFDSNHFAPKSREEIEARNRLAQKKIDAELEKEMTGSN